MKSVKLGVLAGTALLFSLTAAAAPPLSGAFFTTDKNGTIVNGNTQYLSKCGDTGVWLDGGPGPNAPANAAGLPDGDYYFQVTDASGKTLLSTDPVNNRCITVSGGFVIGNCPTGTHNISIDADHGSSGAHTVELCAAGTPFLSAANNGVYKLWVTPVGDGTFAGNGFIGDPTRVDNDCGGSPGCYHGFLASRSKTDNFKANNVASTMCIRVEKQFRQDLSSTPIPGANWQIFVTDSLGTTNTFFTNDQGTIGDQLCSLTPGSYTISEEMRDGFVQLGVQLNGNPVDSSSVLVTLGTGTVTGDQSVIFINRELN